MLCQQLAENGISQIVKLMDLPIPFLHNNFHRPFRELRTQFAKRIIEKMWWWWWWWWWWW
jgi:hypothetical protein